MNKYFSGFLILIYSFSCAAQRSGNYYLHHYTDENGLPQNSVKSIAPDHYGFVWLSTEDGLVRFDGTRFLNFGSAALKLGSARFLQFFPGSAAGRLHIYNNSEELVTIENGFPGRDSLVKKVLSSELINKDGTFPLDGLPSLSSDLNKTRNATVFRINRSPYSYRYANDSISFFDGHQQRYKVLFAAKSNDHFFIVNDCLYHLGQGNTLTYFSPTGAGKVALTGDIQSSSSYKQQRQIRIFWNICVPDALLFYLDHTFYLVKQRRSTELTTSAVFVGVSMDPDDIISTYYDEVARRLYLGSFASGLHIMDRNSFSTLTIAKGSSVYYGQTAYGADAILTAQGHLLNLSGKGNIITEINRKGTWDSYSIVTDVHHNIWIKNKEWLYKFEPQTFRQLGQWQLPRQIALLNVGEDHKLWIGLRGSSIYSIDVQADTAMPQPFTAVAGNITSLQQRRDKLLVGTDNGMYEITLSGKKVSPVAGLEGNYISSIYPATDSNIWITTHGHGIYLLKDKKTYALPSDEHQFLASAHCIVEDKRGFLWITTNKGLFQMAKADLLAYTTGQQQDLYYQYHNRYEGFNTNEFNGNCAPCGITLANGTVSFPSIKGLVTFHPDSVNTLLPDAPLFVDKIVLDGRNIDAHDLAQMPRYFGQLRFYISTPFMGNPENLHITYALVREGEPVRWLPVSKDGIITFNTLLPGNFELLIRKQAGFGPHHFIEKKILFSVRKAWFETSWFYLGCLLLLGFVVWCIFRARIRIVQKRNDILEGMVADKTRELERQTDVQQLIINSISHDVLTPLQYQVLLTRTIYESLLDQNYSAITEPAKVLNEGTQRLHYMIGNLLKYLKAKSGNTINEQRETVAVYELAAEKISIFQPISEQRGTHLHNEVPPGLALQSDAQILSVILHNLLDNAVKVTRNGNIYIAAGSIGGKCQITVRDTGPGLPQSMQDWINAGMGRNGHSARLHKPEHTNGIGLLIVKELITLLGFLIEVRLPERGGTCFTITC
jgi:signal transduction histidine kinase